MARREAAGDRRAQGLWRLAMWGGAGLLLLAPWIAMRFTDEVVWDTTDFAVFGAMLVIACGAYELAARVSTNGLYRSGAAVAVVTGFLLVWANLAVGFIGDENNPANLMYGVVLALLILGAAIARLRPAGMAIILAATALAQALAAAIALFAGWGEALPQTAVFTALWLASAGLFWKAAR